MCGIVGALGPGEVDQKRVIEKLQHRGPDASGVFQTNHVFLGHTRLSILDVSEKGNQPMYSEDGNYVIVFNGEIYNHLELRKNLTEYNFKSTSDTETVLYSFVKHGDKCLNQFIGIFAFAIYDLKRQQVFLARDQFGVKPLYYSTQSANFYFASEIKALESFDFDRSLNYAALKNYMTFMWSPGELTPYREVKKLSPGHFITIHIASPLRIVTQQYYHLSFTGEYDHKPEKKWIDEVEEALYEAVKRQMLSDVPLGFFLSGGLDSSLLVAMAKKQLPNHEIECFTIDTGEHRNKGFAQDLGYAKTVAKHLDVSLHVTQAQIDIARDFDAMVYYLDEPQADPAPLNVLKISALAKRHGIKVMISGAGGDDFFSGYRRHQSLIAEPLYALLPDFFRKGISKFSARLPVHNYKLYRARKLLLEMGKSQMERLSSYFNVQSPQSVDDFFNEAIRQEVESLNPNTYFDTLLQQIPDEKSLVNRMLFMEVYSFLIDHNFNYTDKMGMAEGVEIRVPYADKSLVELSTRIPPNLKMKGITTKYILRKVAERYLPKEVIYRPKTGFGAPIDHWIKNDMVPMIQSRLNNNFIQEQGIFNAGSIEKLLSDNRSGKVRGAYPIWSLLTIQSWLLQFKYKR